MPKPTKPNNRFAAVKKYFPRAKAVGRPAGGRDEDGERQKIGGQRQFERDRIFVEIGGDGRQRRGNDRRIEIFHEKRGRDDQRRNHEAAARPAFLVGHAATI